MCRRPQLARPTRRIPRALHRNLLRRRATRRTHKLRWRTLHIWRGGLSLAGVVRLLLLGTVDGLRRRGGAGAGVVLVLLLDGSVEVALRNHGHDVAGFGVVSGGAVFLPAEVFAVFVEDDTGVGEGADEEEPSGGVLENGLL